MEGKKSFRNARGGFHAPRMGGHKPGGSRGGFRGGQNRGRSGGRGGRGGFSQHIDVSKFINKAVVTTEEVMKYVPTHTFKDFQIDERLKNNIIKKGYVTPTPIQDKAIPFVLLGKDVVGIANTGTGKTAAFLIPSIHKIINNPREKVMVIVPTRELAIQIDNELKGFVFGLGIFSACCVGGAPIFRQIKDLRRRHNFVIGTPGRLKDLVERKEIVLSEFSTIVLDEADRMLDMGFVNDMRYVMSKMQAKRHTLFFSATLSREIEALIGEFLNNPVRVSVKTGDTSKNVDQDIVRVRGNKIDVLHDLLKQGGFDKVLVFGRTKHGVERLSVTLAERGFKVESIHGDKNHSRRQKALNMFKDNHIQILVATDVAARGLDIDGVSHVINYDLPATYEDYVHRIGRTGRGGKTGKALTFVE